jgi:monoamine oxidase
VLTLRDERAPVPVELGAEFVHGSAPLSHALIEAAGVRTAAVHRVAWHGRAGQVRSGDEVWRAIGRVLGSLREDRSPDRSFADFLRAERSRFAPEEVEAACAFVEGFHGAEPERISERSLAGQGGTEGAGNSERVSGGYDVLVGYLKDRLSPGTVRYGRAVKRVRWHEGGVEVEARVESRGETLCARAIVVTAPLGVLKAPSSRAGIVFDPEVPGLAEKLAGLVMGSAVRVTLAFDRPLWAPPALIPGAHGDEGPPSFIHTPACGFNAFWTVEPPGAPVLVAWSGGARSRELNGGAEALARRALDDLSSGTGADAAALNDALGSSWTHDWESDPFSLGAYAYVGVGGFDAPERLAQPVEDTVFFAGEATSAESIGTVEGALASGELAARNVLRALT